ncbi:MAG TPA: hypothetical protein VKA18_10680, partial [Alphaproteobacteria bacterium]|nr:hypothetical protein [Alphaproteobacteria bacterium]
MTQRTVAAALGLILGIVLSDMLGPVGPWAVMTLVCAALSATGLGTTVWLIRRENQWIQAPAWLNLGAVILFALPLGYWRSCDLETAGDRTNLAVFLDDIDEPAVLEFEGSLAAEPELRGHGENDRGTMTVRIERIRREKSPSWTEIGDSNILLRV